ncbi:MAG: MarR family winged helix-turn-helix transcriptional regulator [Bacteroidia bacterium]
MDKYQLIKDLMYKLDLYEMGGNSASSGLTDFANWLQEQVKQEKEIPEARKLNGELPLERSVGPQEPAEVEITRLIVFMYRYAKTYIKQALEGSDIQTADEFAYLASLITRTGMGKSELIQLNIQEKTTGMEILKRLLSMELIYQYDNPDDKRSKCVAITEKGRAAFFTSVGKMQQVSLLVGGDLSDEEKKSLLYSLRKLDHFHHDIYSEGKQKEALAAIQ